MRSPRVSVSSRGGTSRGRLAPLASVTFTWPGVRVTALSCVVVTTPRRWVVPVCSYTTYVAGSRCRTTVVGVVTTEDLKSALSALPAWAMTPNTPTTPRRRPTTISATPVQMKPRPGFTPVKAGTSRSFASRSRDPVSASSGLAGCSQAVFIGVDDDLHAVAEAELHEDPRDVCLDRR